MKTSLVAALCAGFLFLGTAAASAASLAFKVTIDTAALMPLTASKPFALDFQLNGGSPLSNTATISDFNFFGGQATSDPAVSMFGEVSGSLASSVTLKSSASNTFNEFFQGFNPGSFLSFNVLLTSNVNSPTPDIFSIAILDKDLFNIPTTGFGNSLLYVNLNSPNLTLANVVLSSGAPGTEFQNVSVTAAPVPEPASLLLLGTGLVAAASRRRRKP